MSHPYCFTSRTTLYEGNLIITWQEENIEIFNTNIVRDTAGRSLEARLDEEHATGDTLCAHRPTDDFKVMFSQFDLSHSIHPEPVYAGAVREFYDRASYYLQQLFQAESLLLLSD